MEEEHLKLEFQNEEFLLYRLSSVGRRVSALCSERYMLEFGLGVAEWRLLAQVGRFGQATATQISSLTSMDKVAVSRATNRCIAKGLIAETPSLADRRLKELSFTPEGKKFYSRFLPRAVELAHRIEGGLTPEEAKTLKGLLRKLDTHVASLQAQANEGLDVA